MNSIKKVFNKISKGAASLAVTTNVFITKMYCDSFDDAATVANNVLDKVATLGKAIFPAAAVITCVCMFFTRDEKKLATERKLLVGFVAAFILLLLVSNGNLVGTVENLVGGASS